jgi:hypothetical protein
VTTAFLLQRGGDRPTDLRRPGRRERLAHDHGVVFRIACFAVAPGCSAVGEPTTEFTWFPGFAWQVATCRRCREHLGWLFLGPDDRFHGLIEDRLVEADGPDEAH